MKTPLHLLLYLLVVGLASSCSSTHNTVTKAPATTPTPPSLTGTEWVLQDLAGTPALASVKATLLFPEAGRAAGNGSCNRFTGSVQVTGNSIKFGPLASTRMACVDNNVSAQEDRYFKILGAATRYEWEDNSLLIFADGFDKPLRFARTTSPQP